MKVLKKLYEYAQEENIQIKNIDLGEDLIWKGECMYDNNKCMVFLNSHIGDIATEKCTLAHEIGHYKKRDYTK